MHFFQISRLLQARRLYSFVLSLLLLQGAALLPSCGEKNKTMNAPLASEEIPWGSSMEEVQKGMLERRWELSDREPGKLEFALPFPHQEEFQQASLTTEPSPSPYRVAFYFNKDRLSMVSFIREDSAERIDQFYEKCLSEFGFSGPVSSEEANEGVTPAGNRIMESRSLFENKTYVARSIRGKIAPPEDQPKAHRSDELRFMVYDRKENKGISARALVTE